MTSTWRGDGIVMNRKTEGVMERHRSVFSNTNSFELICNGIIGLGIWVLLIATVSIKAQGQQTIFNVPTTDVLDKGKLYFELDISAKPNDSAAVNKFSSLVPRLVVGTGHHIEAGVNILGNIQPGRDSTTISPTIKWKVYDGGNNGWAAVIGDNLFIPVRNRAYTVGTYTYAMTQKTFTKSSRVGFGGYFFSKDVVAANANRAGGQFTFERPLNKKVTLAADWFTGKHGAGYFSPGVIFKVGSKLTGYASYSIGNQNASRGNHYFLLEFGYNFN
jgi:hypothetical protein